MDETGRVCTKCRQHKPWSDFYLAPRGVNGRQARCKSCVKTYEAKRYVQNTTRIKETNKRGRLKRWYGLTQQQLWDMLDAQMDQCPICLTNLIEGKSTHIDHDHATGKVRGILCSNCNLMLGLVKDDTEALARAINYVKENSDD